VVLVLKNNSRKIQKTQNMKLKFTIILAIASFSFFSISCTNRKVTRIDTNDQIDINGSWNSTDSRLTAEELIKQISNNVWLANHLKAKNKKTGCYCWNG